MNYLQKKKLAFMSIVNRVKGFIRTITGALPLTLEGCVDEKSITYYKLYGQSVQNGTPMPDTPIEVESVGDLITNLFDKNNPNLFEAYINTTKNQIGYPASNSALFLIPCKANTTYTIGYDYSSVSNSIFRTACIEVDNITTQTWTNIYNYDYTVNADHIIKTTANSKFIAVQIRYSAYSEAMKTLRVVEGDSLEVCGKYKIPVKVSGKNLFDINKFITLDGNSTYYEINENGELVQKASDYRGNTVLPTVAVLPIGTYIISGFGSWSTFRVVNKTTGEVIVDPKFTLTEPTEIAVKWWAKGGTVIGKPMLREGTTATDYEPYHKPITTNIYLDEPLRKVGEYADYVDFENGKVVRNVCYERMTSVISKSSVARQAAVYLSNIKKKPLQHPNPNSEGYDPMGYALSNKFIKHDRFYSKLSTEPYYIQTYITMGGVNRIAYSLPLEVSTVAQAQEVIGDGFDVFYVLEEAEEQPITLPNIPTFKGTSIISVDTTIQASNAEIEYYSNVKE